MEESESDQRGVRGKGTNGEKKGKGLDLEHLWMDNSVAIDCGRGLECEMGRGGQRGKIGTIVIE